MEPRADGGSFRDPTGRVFLVGGRVFRTVMPAAVEDFDFVRSTKLTEQLISEGRLIPEAIVDPHPLGDAAEGATYILEHPKLPLISYPYEWSFAALKAAAIHHLDLHLSALERGVTLSDATAYNIQFQGATPVFIDSLSFRRYREGEFWLGHRQFCEQFLNPLLLRALVGIPHNAWYRGTLEGISAEALSRVVPWYRKLSWNVLTQVVLQARLQRGSHNQAAAERVVQKQRLSLFAFKHMLMSLRKWIARLKPLGSETLWQQYESDNSYGSEDARVKREAVAEFVRAVKPRTIWDLGCNAGEYSKVALGAGAQCAVGFDFDHGALEAAYARATNEKLFFVPLYLDAANPPPSQGWAQGERLGLAQRAEGDALLALALIHHLVIAKNIPLSAVVEWLVALAPQGLIEFVPKEDPMVKLLLQLREDIFHDYSENMFVEELERRAHIVHTEAVSSYGRKLFWYKRRAEDPQECHR